MATKTVIQIKPTEKCDMKKLNDIMKACMTRPASTWTPAVTVPKRYKVGDAWPRRKPVVKPVKEAPVEPPRSTERNPAIVVWLSNTNPVSMWIGKHTGKGQYAMTRYCHGPVVTRSKGRTGDLKNIHCLYGMTIEDIRLTEKSRNTLVFWAGDPVTDPDVLTKDIEAAAKTTSVELGLNGKKKVRKATADDRAEWAKAY